MTTIPPRASSLWDATPFARGARKLDLQQRQRDARQQAQQRRERVLKHEWASKRLCTLFGYKSATQWNGYVPPAADPAENGGAQLARRNTAPHRAALVQLLRDVAHFDATGQMPGEVLEAVEVEPTESK